LTESKHFSWGFSSFSSTCPAKTKQREKYKDYKEMFRKLKYNVNKVKVSKNSTNRYKNTNFPSFSKKKGWT